VVDGLLQRFVGLLGVLLERGLQRGHGPVQPVLERLDAVLQRTTVRLLVGLVEFEPELVPLGLHVGDFAREVQLRAR
jgi:hypothetical protein